MLYPGPNFFTEYGMHTLIQPAQSQQQALFRVPGDLAREDDLCEKIAPTELVSKNKCTKIYQGLSQTHLGYLNLRPPAQQTDALSTELTRLQ